MISPRGAPSKNTHGNLLKPIPGTNLMAEQELKIDMIQSACLNRHQDKKKGKKKLYILVSHAPVLDLVFERYRAKATNRSEFQFEEGFPGPCSSFEMVMEGQGEVRLVKGINDEYT